MNLTASYLSKIGEIRSSGQATDETSYYPAIEALLSELGKSLKSKVRPVLQLKNHGAGQPDGGLFTQDQLKKITDVMQLDFAMQPPNRGAVEVKGTGEDLNVTVQSEQVAKYLKVYGQVLVTNYRDFRIVVKGQDGKAVVLETYSIAASESAFWAAVAYPQKTAAEHGAHLQEFLTRALLSSVTISTPQHLAGFLASYARDALAKVEARHQLKELQEVRKALEDALGLKFVDEKGEHFFRSTLVQTLFYGLFSAWVLWCREPGRAKSDRFEWKSAVWSLQVPMIRALYERIANPGQLEPLGLVALLGLTGNVLNRVDRVAFFQSFEEGTAVQYFYEPFLEAFDPALRKQLGVWYTPREIVRYMVERVDTVLRTELNLPAGLADPNVYVLDPACGTGAYLVEVLDRIYRTICEQSGKNALTPNAIKTAARDRVFGFEILPAPFVISHLQLGLLLQRHGAPLTTKGGKRERVAVYLTNSLTGWEPPDPTKAKLPYPEFEEEKEEADHVKRDRKILVVLGNPPYNGFAGTSPEEEQGLVEPYKEGLSARWGIKKYNLDDLYIRFFRLAERRIAENTGRGVISFISNFSYLGDPSFVVMRRRFLSEFNEFWLDCLNGDSRETGKLTPDGTPDPSIFSTETNREGIRVGTAICLMVRTGTAAGSPTVRYRDLWGTSKRSELLESLALQNFDEAYGLAEPSSNNRFSLRPSVTTTEYDLWPQPTQFCQESPISGLQEMRKGTLMDLDKNSLAKRMESYLNAKVPWPSVLNEGHGLTLNGGRFMAESAREKILKVETYAEGHIVRYALYPMDSRWAYHSNARPLWNEPRPDLAAQAWSGNSFFITRMFAERPHENAPLLITSTLPDYHLLRPNAVAIPFFIRRTQKHQDKQSALFASVHPQQATVVANISELARAYLSTLGWKNPDGDRAKSSAIWRHSLAIGYSPTYLNENSDGIKRDWPRIPLPNSAALLEASAKLGERVAALLNPEIPVDPRYCWRASS